MLTCWEPAARSPRIDVARLALLAADWSLVIRRDPLPAGAALEVGVTAPGCRRADVEFDNEPRTPGSLLLRSR